MTNTIGIFGVGLIGTALANRLISGGYQVVGYDPDTSRMEILTLAGGQAMAASEIWSKADPVFVAAFDTDQLAEIISRAPEGNRTRLIVVSTCDPDRMAALGTRANAKGLELIEAPISGTSRQLAEGSAVFLIGGDGSVVNDLQPLFDLLGKAHHYVGVLGNGNRAKLAINLVLGLNRAALAEGLVFAEQMGLSATDFLTLARGSAAASQVMETKGPLMAARNFAPQGRVAQSVKDFNLILDAAQTNGQILPFAETYLAMMEDCVTHGEADLDNAAIINALSRARSDMQLKGTAD